jgi:tRNA1Val (adenine37-N6)-methyltransferase
LANNYFNFKQFTIGQENCAMKVGTDGVLLGAWTDPGVANNILDVGTGSGLIAIMLAQRSNAQIDAIEIDKKAYNQALENAKQSPWQVRLNIIHSSFRDYCAGKKHKYDLIVTNPPFFGNSLKAANQRRTLARHNDELPPDELLKGVDQLLAPSGRFCLILPQTNAQSFIKEAIMYNLFCIRKTSVKPIPSKIVSRVLMEFGRYRLNMGENNLIIQNEQGIYTEEYKLLTREFYLNF